MRYGLQMICLRQFLMESIKHLIVRNPLALGEFAAGNFNVA